MAIKKSELYSSLWASVRRAARRHGRQPVQGLRPRPAVHQVRQRQVRRPADFARRSRSRRAPASRTWSRSRARATSATRSTRRSSRRWPTPTAARPQRLPRLQRRRTSSASGKEMVDRLTNLIAIFENPALDFSQEPRRGRRHPRRRLRIPDAALRHRERQEQGPVLHPGRGQPRHRQGHRHLAGEHQRSHHRLRPDLRLGLAAPEGRATRPGKRITLYGQEKDVATAGLARMNMILHDYPTAQHPAGQHAGRSQVQGRRAAQDLRLRRRQSAVLRQDAGAPASTRRTTPSSASACGVPPAKQGDYAYLLHIVRSLKSTGKGACILPHGVLFRGNAEADIRRSSSARATSRASSACPPTSSTAPASPPASSCSTRRTPPPARASS